MTVKNALLRLNKKLETKIVSPNYIFYASNGFARFESLFRLSNKICPMILRWNPETETVSSTILRERSLWPWYFVSFVLLGFVGYLSIIDILLRPELGAPTSVRVLNIGLITLGFLYLSSALVYIVNAEEFVLGVEYSKQLFLRLNQRKGRMVTKDRKWKLFSVAQQGMMVGCALGVFGLVPPGILAKMDPFYYNFSHYFPFLLEARFRLLFDFLRFVETFAVDYVGVRFFGFNFQLIFLEMEIMFRGLEILENKIKMGTRRNRQELFGSYLVFQFIGENLGGPFFLMAQVSMGFGFLALVSFNVATLVGFRFVPMVVYWLFPAVSLAGIGLLYVILRAAVEVYLRTQRLVDKLSQLNFPNKSQMARREERTVRPVAVWCGNLYPLKKGAEADYWYWVFIRTVDSLLLTNFA